MRNFKPTFESAFSCLLACCVVLSALLAASVTRADDTDIFTGASGGSSTQPNVIFLLGNNSNFGRNDTAFGAGNYSTNGGNKQGGAELKSIENVVQGTTTYVAGSTATALHVNAGLAMFTGSNPTGGYIRFGVRDMTNASNLTAFHNIVDQIDPNSSSEKVNTANKDDAAGLYEIYKYFQSLSVFRGGADAQRDYSGNTGTLTGAGQGLTSGFALNGNSTTYTGPSGACGGNFIIYVANNDNNVGQTGSNTYETLSATGFPPTTIPSGGSAGTYYAPTWAGYLRANAGITTYVIDVLGSNQNNASYSTILKNTAIQGGSGPEGQGYFQVQDGDFSALQNALKKILTDITATNSTFASASLPVNTTNRSQDKNQVFIPMFRPDEHAYPRWVGNLKQYQLLNISGVTTLVDTNNSPALNATTGFPTICAQSIWTSDTTTTRWADIASGVTSGGVTTYQGVNLAAATAGAPGYQPATLAQAPQTSPTISGCTLAETWTDAPDGPLVERGGVSEVIRRGNNPPTTTSTPTWTVNRTIYTSGLSSNTLTQFSAVSSSVISTATLNYTMGLDVNNELDLATPATACTNAAGTSTYCTRPSLHGDAVHSRPLPIDYGSAGVTVFYGSNDGMYHAVNATTGTSGGKELWAFVPPEFYSGTANQTRLDRLAQNSPLINFPNLAGGITTPFNGVATAPTRKDYFFDGSTGLFQNADNSKVWIYPVMRRGGRMIYALDVTTATSPTIKWKVGCPDLADDTGCAAVGASSAATASWHTSDITPIGQTWSTPAVMQSVVGYSNPVVIVGGGYDSCEDTNSPDDGSTPNCSSGRKGAIVYVIDADTGALVKAFPLPSNQTPAAGSVIADISVVAVASSTTVDHAYVVDTGGSVYRIDFTTNQSNWALSRIAYTNSGSTDPKISPIKNSGRKFFYAPAVLQAQKSGTTGVYLAFGSGDREHPLSTQYAYGTVINRLYVYVDNLGSGTAVNLDDTSVMSDFTTNPAPGTTGGTTCSTAGVFPGGSTKGWFMNLNQNVGVGGTGHGTGEQVVTSAVIIGGMVAFSTNSPVTGNQVCTKPLGDAWGYWVNLTNGSGAINTTDNASCGGSRSSLFVGGGLPPSPQVGVVPVKDSVTGVATPTVVVIGAVQRCGAGGSNCGGNIAIAPQKFTPPIVGARKSVYWKSSGEN
jgi:type IV pilus assembly protein PilY1